MSDYFTVSCTLCLNESGQPWRRRESCHACAVDVADNHPHPCLIESPPPEVSTRTVQTLLGRVGRSW